MNNKTLSYIFAGVGVLLIVVSLVLRNGTPDASVVITNVASTFMLVAGGVCLVIGMVTYFLRHDDHEMW